MELIIHGDASKVENKTPGNGWSHVETAMYSNPKAVERIRSRLAKINIPGTVHVMFDDLADPMFAMVKDEDQAKMTPLMEEGKVDFFVRNNSGAAGRHNPLTPWILLHRLHHSYEIIGSRFFPRAQRAIGLNTGKLISEMEKEIRHVLKFDEKFCDTDCHFTTLACTMRSARSNQLYAFNLDIAAELFAQYHITGDIKFQGLDDWAFQDAGHDYDKWSSHLGNFQFSNKQIGKFRHFFVSKSKKVIFTDDQRVEIDQVLESYKPRLVAAIRYETEMMKTIPNFM